VTRLELIILASFVSVAVGLSSLHEAMFGRGPEGIPEMAARALLGGFVWGIVVVLVRRGWQRLTSRRG
jgi:hypothetical protein